MSKNSTSSYIIDDDKNRSEMNSLFTQLNKKRHGTASKPYSERNFPASFYRQPHTQTQTNKTKNGHGQHTKNQYSLPEPSLHTKTNNSHVHSRTVSDSAALGGQVAMNTSLSQINSQYTTLPLPDGWEEKLTDNGQIYYIDHYTKSTTWTDPRVNHYAAFQTYCTSLPLPDDYIQKIDSNGQVYFMNQKTKQISLNDPRPNHYRSLMTKRFDVPLLTSSHPQDNLAEKLSTIAKEKQALQQRTQELEKIEAELRKKINDSDRMHDQTTLQSLFDDLLFDKQYASTDSGLGTGYPSSNELFNTFSDFPNSDLFPSPTDFINSPMDINNFTPNPLSTPVTNNSQVKANKQAQQWSSNTRF